MRKLAVLLLAGWTASAFAASQTTASQTRLARQVTVEQLESILTAIHGESDKKAAQKLYDLELIDRLSAARLARAEVELPGPASRSALLMLVDEAEFLDLPRGDLPAIAPPDHATLLSILNQSVRYLMQTISALPNFYATKTTVRFATPPLSELRLLGPWPGGFPVRPAGSSTVTAFYRDGHEMQETKSGKYLKLQSAGSELRTNGEFGPILATVLVDAIVHGRVMWSHWENGVSGRLAVFRFTVAKGVSHYSVLIPGSKQWVLVAYHGEIAVNPLDGSVRRLTLIGDLDPGSSLKTVDVMVSYRPTEIGGRTYICPVKSVALFAVSPFVHGNDPASNNFLVSINDTRFSDYHVFRAETHILGGDGAQPEGSPAAPGPDGASSATPGTTPHP